MTALDKKAKTRLNPLLIASTPSQGDLHLEGLFTTFAAPLPSPGPFGIPSPTSSGGGLGGSSSSSRNGSTLSLQSGGSQGTFSPRRQTGSTSSLRCESPAKSCSQLDLASPNSGISSGNSTPTSRVFYPRKIPPLHGASVPSSDPPSASGSSQGLSSSVPSTGHLQIRLSSPRPRGVSADADFGASSPGRAFFSEDSLHHSSSGSEDSVSLHELMETLPLDTEDMEMTNSGNTSGTASPSISASGVTPTSGLSPRLPTPLSLPSRRFPAALGSHGSLGDAPNFPRLSIPHLRSSLASDSMLNQPKSASVGSSPRDPGSAVPKVKKTIRWASTANMRVVNDRSDDRGGVDGASLPEFTDQKTKVGSGSTEERKRGREALKKEEAQDEKGVMFTAMVEEAQRKAFESALEDPKNFTLFNVLDDLRLPINPDLHQVPDVDEQSQFFTGAISQINSTTRDPSERPPPNSKRHRLSRTESVYNGPMQNAWGEIPVIDTPTPMELCSYTTHVKSGGERPGALPVETANSERLDQILTRAYGYAFKCPPRKKRDTTELDIDGEGIHQGDTTGNVDDEDSVPSQDFGSELETDD